MKQSVVLCVWVKLAGPSVLVLCPRLLTFASNMFVSSVIRSWTMFWSVYFALQHAYSLMFIFCDCVNEGFVWRKAPPQFVSLTSFQNLCMPPSYFDLLWANALSRGRRRLYNVDPNHLRTHLWQSSEHFFSDFIFAFIRLFRLCQRHRPRLRHFFRPWDASCTWESRNPRFLRNRYFTKPRSNNDLWRPTRRVLISPFWSVVENEFVNDHRENKSLWDMSFCIYLIKKFKPETST